MALVPWQIVLLHPLGITLTSVCTLFFIFIWVLIMRTPAMTFLKAGFGRKMILINPDPDKRMVFRIAKKDPQMAYVKRHGYYITDPNHVYIESSSKIPCALTYGDFAESIDSQGAQFAESLKAMNIENYIDIINHFYVEVPAEKLMKDGFISKEEYDSAPNKLYKIRKDSELGKKLGIKAPEPLKIMGKSVPFDNVLNYFSKNTRADLIESKIQHRISAYQKEQVNQALNFLKWATFIGIIMICGALAYNMIVASRPVATTASPSVPATTPEGGVGGIIGKGVDAISGGSGIS